MGLLDIARGIKYRSCERLVTYTGTEIKIASIGINVGPVSVNAGELSKTNKELTTIPEILKVLDTLQYFFCCRAVDLKKDHPLKESCLQLRLLATVNITSLWTLLCIPNPDKQVAMEIAKCVRDIGNMRSAVNDLLGKAPASKKDFGIKVIVPQMIANQGISEEEMAEAVQILME